MISPNGETMLSKSWVPKTIPLCIFWFCIYGADRIVSFVICRWVFLLFRIDEVCQIEDIFKLMYCLKLLWLKTAATGLCTSLWGLSVSIGPAASPVSTQVFVPITGTSDQSSEKWWKMDSGYGGYASKVQDKEGHEFWCLITINYAENLQSMEIHITNCHWF